MNIEKIASWEEIHKAAKEAQDAAEAVAVEVEKGRIYLKPGEKPPSGVSVQRGKRGAMFYESTSLTDKPSVENMRAHERYERKVYDRSK